MQNQFLSGILHICHHEIHYQLSTTDSMQHWHLVIKHGKMSLMSLKKSQENGWNGPTLYVQFNVESYLSYGGLHLMPAIKFRK